MISNSIKQFRKQRESRGRASEGSRSKTKQRLGLAQRQIADTSYRVEQEGRAQQASIEEAKGPGQKINSWADEIDALRSERATLALGSSGPMRPEARYETEFKGEFTLPSDVKSDEGFTKAIDALAQKYNITTSEVYSVIQGESGFNPRAQNKSGATGLFQFMPDTADELGYTTSAIKSMTPEQQVGVYDEYLSRWNYTGANRLGIMQAAPAFADRKPQDVIYSKAKNFAAWDQNPGWRSKGNGDITVQSINSYYAKKAK